MLCLGDLMIVLDTTIVNVALPSIRADLGFTQASLAWVVNAYILTFGGFLLLGGRLGDLFGHRRLFLGGIAFFTLASLACGLSSRRRADRRAGRAGAWRRCRLRGRVLADHGALHRRRPREGDGRLRLRDGRGRQPRRPSRRAAHGTLDWHWIFLVNLPIGIAVFVLSLRLLPAAHTRRPQRLDVAGAILVTGALVSPSTPS